MDVYFHSGEKICARPSFGFYFVKQIISSSKHANTGTKENFRAERLTRNISFVNRRDTILPHSSISYFWQRHGSLLQRPAFPGNLFCANVELKEHVRYAEHGNRRSIQHTGPITSYDPFKHLISFSV